MARPASPTDEQDGSGDAEVRSTKFETRNPKKTVPGLQTHTHPPSAVNAAAPSASWAAVAATDPRAYVASLFLAFVIVAPLSMYVYARVTGWQPQQPWSEVAAAVALIAFALFAYVRHRASTVNALLASGRRVTAAMRGYVDSGQWVNVKVEYDWQGTEMRRTVWLGGSERSRRLKERSQVTLAVDPHRPRRVAVVDLYD